MSEQTPVDRRKQIDAELRRLKAKLGEVNDRDIKAALMQVIQGRQEELIALGGPEAEEAPEPEELPEPPTPERKPMPKSSSNWPGLTSRTEPEPRLKYVMSEQTPVDRRKQIDAELRRLKAKLGEVNDRDIKAALMQVIQGRQEELIALGGPEAEEAPEPEELPEPPTPEQKADAEKLVQQARVEKMRNNTAKVAELIEAAARTAPGSSELQEMLGDELSDGRRYKEALAKYDMARRLDPKNVSADKKHADLVFRTKAAAAGMELSYLDDAETAATAKYAGWISILIPGFGHFLLGKWVTGTVVLSLAAAMVTWIAIKGSDFEGLVRTIFQSGAAHSYNDAILIPLVIGIVNWIYGWGSCFATSKNATSMQAMMPKAKADHPKPPDEGGNLPFE